MFTVKILNYTCEMSNDGSCRGDIEQSLLSHVYLREWESVEVWYPASENYIQKVEELVRETREENAEHEHLEELVDFQSSYKAFVTYKKANGEDGFYCIAELEEVYITDSCGNTVHSIK